MLKQIYEVAFADSSEQVLEFFKHYGFDVAKDKKRLKIDDQERQKIEIESIEILRERIAANDIRRWTISSDVSKDVYALKIRAAGSAGSSSGYRVILMLGLSEGKGIIFHIFSKTGSKRKDNLTDKEENSIRQMVKDLAASKED